MRRNGIEMNVQSMLIRSVSAVITFLAMSVASTDETMIADQDYIDIEFDSITYKFTLPDPFGESELTVNYADRLVFDLQIKTELFTQAVDSIRLRKAQLTGEPSIAVYKSAYRKLEHEERSEISGFTVSLDAGDAYVVGLKDVPGCDAPCNQVVRNIAEVSVNTSGRTNIKIIDIGAALTGVGDR
jgi:hypothetical protein